MRINSCSQDLALDLTPKMAVRVSLKRPWRVSDCDGNDFRACVAAEITIMIAIISTKFAILVCD